MARPHLSPMVAVAQIDRRRWSSSWPMWVIGFTVMIDNVDQYIVRGASNQIERSFHVGDFQIAVLFSAFILVNGLVTMPASYIGDRWDRTRVMAVTVVAWSGISALGGLVPVGAFGLLVVIRGALGFGQAVTDPSGASLVADFYPLERRGQAFSVQTCLTYVGLGLGLGIGAFFGTHFGHLGWRLAFGVSIVPGLLIAAACWRLPEPRRGRADRARVAQSGRLTQSDDLEMSERVRVPVFPNGPVTFGRDMVAGLRADVRTILAIPTMRYALVGVSSILFTVTAVATWMPTLYQRQFHLSQADANLAFAALAIVAGIPGTVIGGMMADRWVSRVLGARVVIPGVCIMVSGSLFLVSFVPMPFAGAYVLEMVAFLAAAASVPALRAGLADAVPATLRGTGFGAFNMAAVIFGSAAAPIVTASIAHGFDGNYRVAFTIAMPFVIAGAVILLLARRHIERDTQKIFEAVIAAIAADGGT